MKFKSTSVGLAMALVLPFSTNAESLDAERVKELALEAILENPQIIMDAVALLQQQQADAETVSQSDVLDNQRNLLERDPNAPVLGNPEGDVTIVEFFDYNCPYCRRSMGEVQALLKADPDVRLVYREWPILSEGSVYAAKAALAARKQGKYNELHWALMGLKGRVEQDTVLLVAKKIGLDLDQLRQDMDAPEIDEHLESSMRLGEALGFSGTPSFVIGDELVNGFVEQAQLADFVKAARESQE